MNSKKTEDESKSSKKTRKATTKKMSLQERQA
jgi:hypothetical protein